MTNHGQVGSRLVPERPALQTYFTGLYDSFILAQSKGEYSPDAWNKLVLLCYRLLQLTTGIRPVRDSLITWKNVSITTRALRLADKDNLHFYESRMIPMTPTMFSWLLYLQKEQNEYLIASNLPRIGLGPVFRDQPSETIFIYMDQDRGEARPITFYDIELIEATINLTFSFKVNALRHYFETCLIEHGADQHVIDFAMGHKHFGSEVFGRFSPIDVPQYFSVASQLIESSIVAPLGIPRAPFDAEL